MAWNRFISFEGPEGCGKSTQVRLLAEHLRALNHEVLVTREPGGTEIGEEIRNLLQFSKKGEAMHPRAELLLFNASRAQLIEEKIQPALARGALVLSDRFLDSTRVYQGMARGLDVSVVDQVIHAAVDGVIPGCTFLLDLDPALSMERLAARAGNDENPDRFERMPADFFHRVREGYLQIARSEPERFHLLDATRPITQLAEEIREILKLHGLSS